MRLSERIIRSKLTPPQVYRTIFNRPRLQEKLAASIKYPITLVHAGTGFGKTTALVELSGLYKRVYWYKITESDRDPTLFLAHLISAFLPETQYLLDRLESNSFTSADNIINALINQLTTDLEDDAILILDDYHLVNNVPAINKWIETLVEQHPPRFRIAIASRQITETPAFIRWRVKGNVLIIDQQDLSFTQDEISLLFSNHHGFHITEEQTHALFSYTDGWIIALEMVWQRLQTSKSKKLDNILAALPTALSDILQFSGIRSFIASARKYPAVFNLNRCLASNGFGDMQFPAGYSG